MSAAEVINDHLAGIRGHYCHCGKQAPLGGAAGWYAQHLLDALKANQYEAEAEFAQSQPSGVQCQMDDCRGHVNWGWCSEHTPLHYQELP